MLKNDAKSTWNEFIRLLARVSTVFMWTFLIGWMTQFEGWGDTRASFDDYTVAAFQQKIRLNVKTDLKLCNFNDPNFCQWIDFRIETSTNFIKEIDENVKSVNPSCMTIVEIYPGIGEDAVRVGADVYDMYQVVDVI